jgi:hypothetical protein
MAFFFLLLVLGCFFVFFCFFFCESINDELKVYKVWKAVPQGVSFISAHVDGAQGVEAVMTANDPESTKAVDVGAVLSKSGYSAQFCLP